MGQLSPLFKRISTVFICCTCLLLLSCNIAYGKQENINNEAFTDNKQLDSIVQGLFTETDIKDYQIKFLLALTKNNFVQIGVLDKDNKFIAVTYIKRNYIGIIKIPAKYNISEDDNNASSTHADFYADINLGNWEGNRLVGHIKMDKVKSKEYNNKIETILGSLNISKIPSVNIEQYGVCSFFMKEKFVHNSNCDFDNNGNCLLFYQYYDDSYNEECGTSKSRIVKYNICNPQGTLTEICDFKTRNVQISPFYDGNKFRLLVSENASLYITDENGDNKQKLKINELDFNVTNYNDIIKSLFSIRPEKPYYKYFSAREIGFSIQTKIIKHKNNYYLLINSPREDGAEIFYKVPMLLKSKDAIHWEPVLLLHKVKNGKLEYIKSKGEHSITCTDSSIYIAVRGGDSNFDGKSTIYTGTTVLAYKLSSLSKKSEVCYYHSLKTSLFNSLGESKPFIDIVNGNPIVVYRSNDSVYDDYPRNSIWFYDCFKDEIVGKMERSCGIHYVCGKSYGSGMNITFLEDARGFYKSHKASGKHSNIGYSRISFK